MYCQTCGIALTHQTKYCNRCGALIPTSETRLGKMSSEKRLDEYLDGLFWISVFGLAFILGGMVLLKKVQFSETIIIAYMILSSTAFLINFGFSLWGTLSIMRDSKDGKLTMRPERIETAELNPEKPEPFLAPAPSVTENTTRSFEPVYNKRKPE